MQKHNISLGADTQQQDAAMRLMLLSNPTSERQFSARIGRLHRSDC
jgi:hypothetical protein